MLDLVRVTCHTRALTSRVFIWLVLVWNLNTVESIQLLCIGWNKKKNQPKRLKNSLFDDKLDYCWFSHVVIKNSHRRIFDAPEFFLSWSITATENEYSNKFSLRKGSSLFCDHSELEFLSFCVMGHSWRPRELSRTRRLKKWLIWGGGGILLCEQLSYSRKSITLMFMSSSRDEFTLS